MTARANAGAAPVLVATGLTRRFGSFTAVAGADLTAAPGEVVGLLGANGAGKTTLLRMILGLLRPSAGTVTLFGRPPSRAIRRKVGYVPQGLGLYTDLTLAENLAFSAAAYGAPRPDPGDLTADLDRLVGDAPRGTQRRAAFAAALAHDPALLVLDEPTSGVDPLARAQLWDTIHRSAERGTAVLVTTHHMDEAEQCDRLVVMVAGSVRADGPLAGILGHGRAIEVRSPEWDRAFLVLDGEGLALTLHGTTLRLRPEDEGHARRALAGHGVEADLRPVPITLEEALVRLAG